jgi:hypothetical protein
MRTGTRLWTATIVSTLDTKIWWFGFGSSLNANVGDGICKFESDVSLAGDRQSKKGVLKRAKCLIIRVFYFLGPQSQFENDKTHATIQAIAPWSSQ